MDHVREHLLARTRCSCDEDGDLGAGRPPRSVEERDTLWVYKYEWVVFIKHGDCHFSKSWANQSNGRANIIFRYITMVYKSGVVNLTQFFEHIATLSENGQWHLSGNLIPNLTNQRAQKSRPRAAFLLTSKQDKRVYVTGSYRK